MSTSRISELAQEYYERISSQDQKIVENIQKEIDKLKDTDFDEDARIIIAFEIESRSLNPLNPQKQILEKCIEQAKFKYKTEVEYQLDLAKTPARYAAIENYFNPLLNVPVETAQKGIGEELSPKDLITLRLVSKGANFLFTPALDKPKALQALTHAAHARKEGVWHGPDLDDPTKIFKGRLFTMLDEDPNILMTEVDFTDPCNGIESKGITLGEFVLANGMAEVFHHMAPYYDRLTLKDVDGPKERQALYDKYAPLINTLYNQPAYDWLDLFNKLMNAPNDVVDAILNQPTLPEDHPHYGHPLYQALLKLRQDWAPEEIDGKHPQMHDVMHVKAEGPTRGQEFSVLRSLQDTDDKLFNQWNALYQAGGNNYRKSRFVWRLVNGFMKRRATGEERCKFAQGFCSTMDRNEPFRMSTQYTDTVGHYPDTPKDDSLTTSDLGGGFSVDEYYGASAVLARLVLARCGFALAIGQLMSSTKDRLAELTPRARIQAGLD